MRSTNSGVSAVVDPVGRELARTGTYTRENIWADIHLMQMPHTLYQRFGDWPGWLALMALVGMFGYAYWRSKKSGGAFGRLTR